MYTRVFLAESVWRVWKTQCNIFIWNFSILRLAHRLGTTHDSRKWMSHRVSVFLCSEGDGVTHSTSRDFQNSHVTGELWPSLSGIFQFLILSLLRMPGGAVRIRRSLDKRTRDKMARPLYFFHRKIRLYINFLDSYIIHWYPRNALIGKQLFVIRLNEKSFIRVPIFFAIRVFVKISNFDIIFKVQRRFFFPINENFDRKRDVWKKITVHIVLYKRFHSSKIR